MIDVPAEWLQAASGTHRPRWRARILAADGTVIVDDLPVTGGQIIRDEGSNPRTQANVDVPTAAVPSLLDQAYLPTGGRLQLQWTLAPPQWVAMADVDLVASAIARPEDMWTLAGTDRSARIALDDMARGAVPALAGKTHAAAITDLVHRTFPADAVAATGPATTQTVPAGYGGTIHDGDPWRLIEQLAEDAGSEVFYTTARTCAVRPAPGTAAPVDALSVGAGGQITGYTIDHEMGYNHVAIAYVNEGTDQVMVRGTWTDTRPDSPVAVQRIGSRVTLGRVVRADAAPAQAAADAAAAALGARYGGRARMAEVRHPTRPWLEPGDTVAVTYLGGPTEHQVVRSVGIDLGPANIQVTRFRNHEYKMGVPVL